MDYTKQAAKFAAKNGVKLEILNSEFKKHFADEKQPRMVYRCKLSRNGKQYAFDFGASIAKPEEPNMYDILACMQKYDTGSFEDFCGEFGYDTDSRTEERTYKAVQKEFKAIERLFSDVLEELQEIA